MTSEQSPELDRRTFLAASAAGVAGLALASGAAPAPAHAAGRPAQQRPNIVLALYDDLGIGDLGAYGAESIRTPTINMLARTGVRCDAMYAAAATDSPSRAGLFTGRYGARFSVPDSVRPDTGGGLPADVPTVATALKAAGYRTALFGQWRLGSAPDQHPSAKGFDTFSGTLYGSDVTPLAWHEGAGEVDPEIDLSTSTERIHDAAEAFLADVGPGEDTPYFIVLSYLVPHTPYRAPANRLGTSDAGEYGDVVESVDAHLGQLVRRLRGRRSSADTLIIVTSDNGPRYEGSTQGRRGRKPEVMDGGVLVPFVASWLYNRKAAVDTVPRSLLDLAPTVCALAGVPALPQQDGADMSPLLLGGTSVARGPVGLYYGQWLNSIRDGRWKVHFRFGADTRTYMPMLYDIDADPRESNNLAEYQPDVVESFRPLWDELRTNVAAEAAARAEGADA